MPFIEETRRPRSQRRARRRRRRRSRQRPPPARFRWQLHTVVPLSTRPLALVWRLSRMATRPPRAPLYRSARTVKRALWRPLRVPPSCDLSFHWDNCRRPSEIALTSALSTGNKQDDGRHFDGELNKTFEVTDHEAHFPSSPVRCSAVPPLFSLSLCRPLNGAGGGRLSLPPRGRCGTHRRRSDPPHRDASIGASGTAHGRHRGPVLSTGPLAHPCRLDRCARA